MSLKTAMILAAGLGSRLGEGPPKPLRRVGGKALIDHALDALVEAGVKRAVVNTHHRAEKIETHLAERTVPEIAISREPERLETGGGILAARRLLGDAPFFAINADTVWSGGADFLAALARRWKPSAMDALLLIYPTVKAPHYHGRGDYLCTPDGRLERRPESTTAPFLFTGAQILSPSLFDRMPGGAWSLNLVYDKAEAAGRLYGLRLEGEWLDAGTPERLAEAERRFGPP